jgi:hypothetical protein
MLSDSLQPGTLTLSDQNSSQIFVTSPSNKLQHISLIRDVHTLHNGPIKQEFFVRNDQLNHNLEQQQTEITIGTATVTANNTNSITQSENVREIINIFSLLFKKYSSICLS